MLTVGKPCRAPTTEKSFEDAFGKRLTAAGLWNRHMADRMAGVLDRYVRGGTWIEFKSLSKERDDFKWGEGMTREQHDFAKAAVEGGDRAFYCALLHRGGLQRVAFESYRTMMHRTGPDMAIMFEDQWEYSRTALDMIIRSEIAR